MKEQIDKAAETIKSHLRLTELIASDWLSNETGAQVFLKTENLQVTGSFKVRGALNKILSLGNEDLARGVVTASTGNHGAAVAYASRIAGTKARVYVSTEASKSKVENIRRLGAEIVEFGFDPIEAEIEARRVSEVERIPFISPYNDIDVVAGQGTIGVELHQQLERIDAVFVALGGGGLISGIGSYLKNVSPNTEIVACSPENSKVMHDSLEMGELHGDLPSKPTLSDGTAGGVEDGSITFELCKEVVDSRALVSEEEIAKSLRDFLDIQHMLIEGAAAVPVAALRKNPGNYRGKNVVIVLCGANIGTDTLRSVLQ